MYWVTARKNSVPDSSCGLAAFIQEILGGYTKRTNRSLRTRPVWTSSTGSGTRTESGYGCRTARQRLTKKAECSTLTDFCATSRSARKRRPDFSFRPRFWKHRQTPRLRSEEHTSELQS